MAYLQHRNAGEVHAQHPLPVVLGDVGCEAVAADGCDPGVVVEDVQPAEAADGLVDQVPRLRPVAGVGGDADGLPARRADGGHGGVGGGRVEVAHDDPCPLARESKRSGAAEPRAGAGDESDAVMEAHAAAIPRRALSAREEAAIADVDHAARVVLATLEQPRVRAARASARPAPRRPDMPPGVWAPAGAAGPAHRSAPPPDASGHS